MIIVNKSDLIGTARDASGPGWRSVRMLVRSDGMGFSVNETTCDPEAVLTLEYKHHIEACYCVAGSAVVTELDTGATHTIAPDVLYAPNANDRHELRVTSDKPLRLISVFAPALQGDEVHGEDGGYSA
jgi:L-ectoine synthase